MDYQLMISPDLDLSPSDILAAWNADATARDVAQAHLTPSQAKLYDPTLAAIVTLVSTVGVGVLTNALYDVLKAAILKKHGEHPKKHFKLTQLDQPDGTHLLIIEQDEE